MEEDSNVVATLREFLSRSAGEVDLIETHISWVLLAGEAAYKIKKPVRFDFLDFSTLEKRRFFCNEEVRLNRRLAPRLYESVAKVTRTEAGVELDGSGEECEFAVKMQRFPQDALLSAVAKREELTGEMIDATAATLAGFHGDCDRADPGGEFGRPEDIIHWVEDNFGELKPRVTDAERVNALEEIETWSVREGKRLAPALAARLAKGSVRECHGDLHLRNIAWLEGKPVFFDCIEFNPALRWIDVMSEVAFLVMDLEDRGFPRWARTCLNRYLAATGDYAGLPVLRYYLVYRAMVRAKVAALREEEGGLDAAAEKALWEEFDTYLRLARRFMRPDPPLIVLMHGLAGSGKSTVATAFVEEMDAVQLRSDVERKRLFGMDADARTKSAVEGGIYSTAASQATYARLAEGAEATVSAGWTAVLDATFLRRADRSSFRELGARMGAPVVILDVTAPPDVLEERVKRREADGTDASEAGVEVLHRQQERREPLEGWECAQRIAVDSSRTLRIEELADAIREKARPSC